jgi:hypothetical protein
MNMQDDPERGVRTIRAAMAALLGLAGLLLPACGNQPPLETAWPEVADRPFVGTAAWSDPGQCRPLPGEAARGGVLTVAFNESVDPAHAPVPMTRAERTVFANLYETLTRVTCEGVLAPGLAVRWDRLSDGSRWRLHLREDAVFWDGQPVTAGSVIDAWRVNEQIAARAGRPSPGLWLATGSLGLLPLEQHLLEIRLAEPQDDLPYLLAHPDLAVASRRQGWLWPLGSGPCRLDAETDLPLPDLVCRPHLHHPERPAWQSLTFRVLPAHDPRDVMIPGVDLAVVSDRRAAAFYAELPELQVADLPWDRLYVLALPPYSWLDTEPLRAAAFKASTPSVSRAWNSFFFHPCRASACPQLQGPTLGFATPTHDRDPTVWRPGGFRVHHLAADTDARALAERIVAFQRDGYLVEALTGPELAGALQAEQAAGFVLRLDAGHVTACLQLAALLARAHWLQQGALDPDQDPCRAAERLRTSGLALPLVTCRDHLVWRGELAGLALTHDGALLLGGLGPALPEVVP